MKLFKFRDKKEKLGVILAASSFLPTFIITVALCYTKYIPVALIILMITQISMICGVQLCCGSLERENEKLKNKLKEMEM